MRFVTRLIINEAMCFCAALVFLSRLPLPLKIRDERVFGRGTTYFPLAGLVIGGILWGLYRLAIPVYSPVTAAALLLAGEWLLTGGLHLDGLMDSIDGLFSGRPPERILEIMRDSRVGALGAAGGILLLFIKFSLLSGLPTDRALPVLMTVAVLSRWSMVPAIALYPYARAQGVGSAFHAGTGKAQVIVSSTLAGGIAFGLLGIEGIAALVVTAVYSLLISMRVSRRLGGLTGDIYGALAESGQVLLLLFLAARGGW